MYYAEIKKCDIANGPGARLTLFVSGCNHRCKGCFNEVAWDFKYGRPFTQQVEEELIALLERPYIHGLSVLGGEPLDPANIGTVAKFLHNVAMKHPDKTIWLYTGYTLDIDTIMCNKEVPDDMRVILSCCDVIVDGPFIEDQKDLTLRFRGSANQRLIHIPETLKKGEIVLWDDWQSKEGMRSPRRY